MKTLLHTTTLLGIVATIALSPSSARGCTGITIKAKDGAVIFARTLEFATDLKSNILVIPRGKEYVGTAPGGKPGMRWKTKFGVVGANAFGMPVTIDGMNEKGVSIGLFYFPGFAKYQNVTPKDFGKAIAPWEIGVYLLSTCSNVKEAVAAAKGVYVGEVVQKDMGIVPGVHAIVTDASGKSVVLEYVGGELKVHDNPFGVLTNAPTFDWHVTNLSNYITLSRQDATNLDLAGKVIRPLGQGSGMLGLPGDFTPPSRSRAGCRLFQDGIAGSHRQRSRTASIPPSEPVRYSQGLRPGHREWRAGVRLHTLDGRRRLEESAVLLPHL